MTTPEQPQTYPLSPEGVAEALRTLDLESWEIAEKLKALGVKGVQMDECRCALAVYIATLLPDASSVHVEVDQVRINGSLRDEFGFDFPVVLSRDMPGGAQDFIAEFDDGKHPELIEGAAA